METNQRNTNHMEYLEGMEQLQSDIFDRVLAARESYQPESYTSQDVRKALEAERRTAEDFAALLSPAAEPFGRTGSQGREGDTETVRQFCVSVYPRLYFQLL